MLFVIVFLDLQMKNSIWTLIGLLNIQKNSSSQRKETENIHPPFKQNTQTHTLHQPYTYLLKIHVRHTNTNMKIWVPPWHGQ